MHLPPFDPSLDFKAALNMRFAGRPLLKGAPIDKTLLGDDEAYRDRQLKLLYENHRITPMTDDEAEAAEIPLTEEQLARVDQLVADNDRTKLNALAAGEPHKIASPESFGTKADVATAIVRAEAAAAA